jgi:hypothetical protein|tara:strand:- start:235 stop:813 length:579 start_codon:yes stop_codon:yes gene_type:complete
MAVLIKDYNSVFIHIPKTGGSSIQQWLMDNTDSYITKGTKHHTLNAIESKYGKFDFSFAVVRNPWDWCVSWYFFSRDRALRRINHPKNKGKFSLEYNQRILTEFDKGFEYFVENTQLTDQFHRTVGIDYIIKLENINEEIKVIAEKFNINKDLPVINASSRNKNYQEYYNDNTRAIIQSKFTKDINFFNYKF